MRSLLGTITNKAPAYTGRASTLSMPWARRNNAEAQLGSMSTVGTLFAIVNRTSTAVASTEWKLWRKTASGKDEDRTEVTAHAALDLLRKPNPFMPQQEFLEVIQQHLDLTGEAWWIVSRNPRATLPLELWPVRPDKMAPVPHPTEFLAGYTYTDPDGAKIPLGLDEVIQLRMPNPLDPYRGLGPVQAMLTDIDSAKYTAEWNRNFFRNSAEPGGVIEVEKRLADDEFDEMRDRWNEQHRGVANAHRVAIIEQGKWVNRTFTMRDMQFAELRHVARDVIMEGFGFPKSMIGAVDDVNRANAEAGEYVFAKWLTVPRLERIKSALNNDLLPLFGKDTALEFDYESPVPEDEAAENAERLSKATAAKTYIDAGFDGVSVAEALNLPDGLVWEKPVVPAPFAPPKPPADPAAPKPPAPPAPPGARWAARNATTPDPPPDGWPAYDPDTVDAVDLAPVQAAWEKALATLLGHWRTSVVADWIDQLVEAVRAVVHSGDLAGLTALSVDSAAAADELAAAMAALAATAAGHAVDEAADQDVTLHPAWPTDTELAAIAGQVAAFEAQRYALTAGQEASRVAWPDADPDTVAEHVRTHLDELSDAGAETALGGALTDAQNQARRATQRSGPVGALYASEQMDRNTCRPCRAVHGRWVANTDDLAPLLKLYPAGGYVDCLGRWRCRGTTVGVWRPQTTKGGQ
jgi:HK97 family phage portal protein